MDPIATLSSSDDEGVQSVQAAAAAAGRGGITITDLPGTSGECTRLGAAWVQGEGQAGRAGRQAGRNGRQPCLASGQLQLVALPSGMVGGWVCAVHHSFRGWCPSHRPITIPY